MRLVRGRPEDETVYAADPAEVAVRFVSEGAEWLHVVDLDAALGTGENGETILRVLSATDAPVQVGGGLRTVAALETVFEAGAARAVLGTRAAEDPEFVGEVVSRFGDAIVVALDSEAGEVRVRGWSTGSGALEEVLAVLEAAGARRFLVTAVGRDGTMTGPDLGLYEWLRGLTDAPVIASGGVRDSEDIRALAATGVEAVVVGKALYEGTLTIPEAKEAAR